jgi:DNA-binding MarR family transcriptional regulator
VQYVSRDDYSQEYKLTAADLPLLLARLIAVQVELFEAADARLRTEAGMPLVALLPLRVIRATPGCRVQELAAGLGLSVGGASKSADRLERRGWLRRTAHPSDRRSLLLELTEEGIAAAAAGDAVVESVMRELVVPILGEAEAEHLSSDLARLRRADTRTNADYDD